MRPQVFCATSKDVKKRPPSMGNVGSSSCDGDVSQQSVASYYLIPVANGSGTLRKQPLLLSDRDKALLDEWTPSEATPYPTELDFLKSGYKVCGHIFVDCSVVLLLSSMPATTDSLPPYTTMLLFERGKPTFVSLPILCAKAQRARQ